MGSPRRQLVSDPTILHSLARSTFEETGLRLAGFYRQIGSVAEFVTGYGASGKRCCTLYFEIEVTQVEDDDKSAEGHGGHGKWLRRMWGMMMLMRLMK